MTNSTSTERQHAEILGALWLYFRDTEQEAWQELFTWADIGLPLSYMVWQDLATATPDGTAMIEETWQVFCEMISIDPAGNYSDLREALNASPNPIAESSD